MEFTQESKEPLLQQTDVQNEIVYNPYFKEIHPYRESFPLKFLMVLLIIFSGGVFGLVLHWSIRPRFWFKKKVPPNDADKFLIHSLNGTWETVPVKIYRGHRIFEFEGNRFYWEDNQYVPHVQEFKWTYYDILHTRSGLEKNDLTDDKLSKVGPNIISVPEVTLIEDILKKFFDPIAIYDYFCVTVWYVHKYFFFATIILIISFITSTLIVRNQRNHRSNLKAMAQQFSMVRVMREGVWQDLSSQELFPGDFIEIPHKGFAAPADLVLVSGSVLVDESFLTGESLPVVKFPPEDDKWKIYDPEKDKRHSIYCSTTVTNSSQRGENRNALAMVTRTGYMSSKGQLVKVILYNKSREYVYQTQAIIAWACLLGCGTVMFFYSLYTWGVFNDGVEDINQVLYGFESLTCTVSPLLPLIFNIVMIYSAKNLEALRIHTINPSNIPICGKVKTMCFDKTGTLTKSDLDVIGVVPVHLLRDAKYDDSPVPVTDLEERDPLLHCLATCHSLAHLGDFASSSGVQFSGTTVDIKMFVSTQWHYSEPVTYSPRGSKIELTHATITSPSEACKMEVLKRFDFDHALQRMSVIVKGDDGKINTFVKGSAEVIFSLCDPKTLPPNAQSDVIRFSRNGCYVLALATREGPKGDVDQLNNVKRHDLEADLTFLGLLLLRNEIKPESREVMYHLKQGRIRSVIVTGDNIFTAFYIARECGIITSRLNCFVGDVEKDKNGEKNVVFRDLYDSKKTYDINKWTNAENRNLLNIGITSRAFKLLLARGYDEFLCSVPKIFARFRPLQKEQIVKLIMQSGEVTGMCGDGANDCAALSCADFGVALCEAEASLAAPFTAKSLSPLSTIDLIKEGRSCMATNFALFKYTLFMNVTQATLMFVAYHYGGDLSEMEYVFLDFGFFFPTAWMMVITKSAPYLKGNPPTSKIFGPTTLFSYFGLQILAWLAILTVMIFLNKQGWYIQNEIGVVAVYQIAESTTLWYIALFLYPAVSISLSFGNSWRQPIYTNKPYMVTLILELIYLVIVFSMPPGVFGWFSFMELVDVGSIFKGIIIVIGTSAFCLIIIWEKFIVTGPIASFFRKLTGRGRPPPENW